MWWGRRDGWLYCEETAGYQQRGIYGTRSGILCGEPKVDLVSLP
ncbi:hypothetical protein NC652_030387 [Populus alba x Populus x berolinensis]|nr:hypothetical protein NC652_030387 [Populus alba x Populus x berolinensis]